MKTSFNSFICFFNQKRRLDLDITLGVFLNKTASQ